MKYQHNDKFLGTAYDQLAFNQELNGMKGGVVARFEPNTYIYSATVYVTKVATGNNDAIEVKNRDGSVTIGTFDGTALGKTTLTVANSFVKSGNDLLWNLNKVDGAKDFDGEARLEIIFSHEAGGGYVVGNPKQDDSTVFTPVTA